MAYTSGINWECRTTGNGQNGGGFDSSFGGTDYSQQDSPQLSLTDCTTSTVSTALTSVTGGFTALMVGNVVWLGASGSDDGRRQIAAYVSATEVTLDSNAPANRAGVGYCKVGGAYLISSGSFGFNPVAGNKIWIKAGTYTITTNAMQILTGSVTQPVVIEGYNTTRGDITTTSTLTRPKLVWGSGSIQVFTLGGTAQIVRHLEVDGTGTIFAALGFTSSTVQCVVDNCKVTAGSGAVGIDIQGAGNTVRRSYILGGALASDCVLVRGSGGHTIEFNHLKGSATSTGACLNNDAGRAFIRQNILETSKYGLYLANGTLSGVTAEQNAIWLNTDTGIYIGNAAQAVAAMPNIRYNLIGKNTTADVKYNPSDISANAGVVNWMLVAFDTNFFYTTATDRYKNLPAGYNDQVLTASPFTSDTTGDYSLNSTAGAGALIRSTPVTVPMGDGTNNAYVYGGFIGAPPVATDATTNLATLRSLWRELTGEQDTTEVPNATVDIYLMSGLEALNRRVGYHLTTDTDPITLVDGTEEYDIPTDCVEVVFVEHNGQPLEKSSIEEWRKEGINWRYGKKGKPSEWAMYGNKLVVYPRPDAQTVAESAYLALRYISTPPSITTAGPEQLNTQDWRVVVYFGVAEWSRSYPDGAFAQKRADDYQAKFEAEAQAISANYRSRGVSR